MNNWFKTSVSYEKILENGMQKKVTEPFLIDALSFSEAEARITEEIHPYISGDFTIADIKREKYSEVFFNEQGDRYFSAKVEFITLDEKSGNERKTSVKMLVQASDIQEAKDVLTEGMEGTLADWQLVKLEETKIMDVFVFSEKEYLNKP